jgi:hypothetical protein
MCGRGISPGMRTTITDIRSHNNETSGIGGGGEQVIVRNVELDHNGSPALLGCCAAGIKSGNSYSISDSYVHDNHGVGIWCDVGCKGGSFTVVNNVVTNSLRGGIRYEISAVPAVIRGNTVKNNNTSARGGHGGIEINSSRNALVEGNVLGGNRKAGILLNGNRPPGVGNVTVRGNSLNGDALKGCSGSARCHDNK